MSTTSPFPLIKMSALFRNLKPNQILHFHEVLNIVQRVGARQCHWLINNIPGPRPKTPEEINAAAKKYNLLPEEYEPYPDTEEGCGDYPKLPYNSVDSKDPWCHWDFQSLRRDYNEPIHSKMIYMVPEGLSTTNMKENFLEGLSFLLVGGVIVLVTYISTKFINLQPVCEKQYPAPGVVHYTFELTKKKKKIRDPSCDEED